MRNTAIAVVGALGAALAWTPEAAAICREVTEHGSDEPSIDPDQTVLLIKRKDVPIGCPGSDAGAPADAGTTGDASEPNDASGSEDASIQQLTLSDAGAAGDAGPNDASQSIGDGGASYPDAGPSCQPSVTDAITMVVQPKFSVGTNGARFALLMVTPAQPTISTASASIFEQLDAATAPQIQWQDEYVEDPALGYQCNDPKWNQPTGGGGCGGGGGSTGGDWSPPIPDDTPPVSDAGAGITTIGPYEVGIIPSADIGAVQGWLVDNQFDYDSGDLEALRPYVELGWSVIAVRVSADSQLSGAGLVPLAFTYAGTELRIPLGLSRQDQFGQMALRIYIAAESRYDVPGASVGYANPSTIGGAQFLTRNDLWADLSRTADEDPVAEPKSGTYHAVEVRTRTIRIPSSECPSLNDTPDPPPSSRDIDCGCRADGMAPWGDELGLLGLLGFCALMLRRRRSSRR